MIGKNEAFQKLDTDILTSVEAELRQGRLVVLVGVTGSGKSVLAKKALPDAVLITGIDPKPALNEVMDCNLIGEELHQNVSPDEFIRYRNQALALGHGVIVTGQIWDDVRPHLAGLETNRYRVFNLNSVWELLADQYVNNIPKSVLAN